MHFYSSDRLYPNLSKDEFLFHAHAALFPLENKKERRKQNIFAMTEQRTFVIKSFTKQINCSMQTRVAFGLIFGSSFG